MDIEFTINLRNVDPMLIMMMAEAQSAEDIAEVQREVEAQSILEKIAAFKERFDSRD